MGYIPARDCRCCIHHRVFAGSGEERCARRLGEQIGAPALPIATERRSSLFRDRCGRLGRYYVGKQMLPPQFIWGTPEGE